MKKIMVFLAVAFMAMSMSVIVFAEDMGTINIQVDVKTNQPEGFQNYNFAIVLMNETLNKSETYDILYVDDYHKKLSLPFGTYSMALGGVENDSFGTFDLKAGDSFTISKEYPTIEVKLGFNNFDAIHNKQEQPATPQIITKSEKPEIISTSKPKPTETELNSLVVKIIATGVLGIIIVIVVVLRKVKKTKS